MSAQRTMLPYRLARDAAAQEIRDAVATCRNPGAVELLMDRVMVTADWIDGQRLYTELCALMSQDEAHALAGQLLAACRAVWLNEREWKFPHGFALVPMSFYRPTAGGVA